MCKVFDELNAPFKYDAYKYDEFNNNVYVGGQAVAERLNKVLGVGLWKYEGLYNTEKIITDGNNKRIKIFVKFSIYNKDLKEWIEFVDAGSEQVKKGMNEGDATKSAITDGMKKCASRIGVASDLYNGLIRYDKQRGMVIVPNHYRDYYVEMGWIKVSEENGPSEENQNNNDHVKRLYEMIDHLLVCSEGKVKQPFTKEGVENKLKQVVNFNSLSDLSVEDAGLVAEKINSWISMYDQVG